MRPKLPNIMNTIAIILLILEYKLKKLEVFDWLRIAIRCIIDIPAKNPKNILYSLLTLLTQSLYDYFIYASSVSLLLYSFFAFSSISVDYNYKLISFYTLINVPVTNDSTYFYVLSVFLLSNCLISPSITTTASLLI